MHNLKIYCMCLDNNYLEIVKSLNYIPVGLKNENFSAEWTRDNTKINISKKNPYYGEYTFYYWFWKNLLKDKKNNEWVGFCSYRELWGKKNREKKQDLKSILLQELPKEWENFEAIIGEPMPLKKVKFVKLIKYGKLALFKNPKEIFKSNHSIRFQFDMFHGVGNLDKAINLLPEKDRADFNKYVRNETSINQGNMFIAKSEKVMNAYFTEIFSWLEKCEKVFGFDLEGYNKIRMYTFLAERFLPYWFKKYTKYLEWPVVYCDINKR
tara:strand:+ start:497 stop:1297 length:801 start_codon:yes stop_codon:yes gene_type:complete